MSFISCINTIDYSSVARRGGYSPPPLAQRKKGINALSAHLYTVVSSDTGV